MRNVRATPPSLMVARKIATPIVLIVDPQRIPDAWTLSGSAGRFELRDFHEFVRRDLKRTMSEYFSSVIVLRSDEPRPTGAHWLADVRVDFVRLHDLMTGELTYTTVEMGWAFGLRPHNADEYLVSFTGTARSREAYRTFEQGCAQMIESAIGSLNEEWADKNVIRELKIADDSLRRSERSTATEVPPAVKGKSSSMDTDWPQ